jgi:O-methyltransferase involved in polyketide biosynthesis
MADEIVRKLDYDFEQFKVNKNFILNVALRAKKLDEVASGFIRHHPDAVGLDLGAGLDTRLVRIAAPATVDWYDVDYPAVVAARERLIPIAATLTHRRRRDGARLAEHHPQWTDRR